MAANTNKKLQFIKRTFVTVDAAKSYSTTNLGSIVFDETHKVICVNGQAYGEGLSQYVSDATFTNSILTITKSNNTSVTVDFSDIASARGVMNVFEQLYSKIGLTGSGTGLALDYSNTNYLASLSGTAATLVNADKTLDAAIKNVSDTVGTLGTEVVKGVTVGTTSITKDSNNGITIAADGYTGTGNGVLATKSTVNTALSSLDGTATIASVSNDIVTIKAGIEQTNGEIANDSGSDITLAKVAKTGTATDVTVNSGLYGGTTAVTDAQSALDNLATAIGSLGTAAVKDVTINGSTVKNSQTGVAEFAVDGMYDETNNKIASVDTVTNAIEDLDVTEFALGSKDNSTNVITIHGIKETDGEIAVGSTAGNDITFAAVAATGDASDVSYTNTIGTTSITNVDDALDAIIAELSDIGTDAVKDVTINGTSIVGSEGTAALSVDGTIGTDNKLATQSTVTNAIGNLDTQNDVQAVTYTAATGSEGAKLTFNGISEADGIIASGTGTTSLQFAKVATTGAAGDVTYDNTTSHLTATDVNSAIDELQSSIEALQGDFDVIVSSSASDTPTAAGGQLAPSAYTFHKIYLVANAGSTPNSHSEYITTRSGSEGSYTYGWEKLGDIDIDLTGYAKSITMNGTQYSVTGTGTDIALGRVITSVSGESSVGGTTDYVSVEASTTSGTGATTVELTSHVKTQAVSTATSGSGNGLATAHDVKQYVDSAAAVTDAHPEIIVNDTTAATIGTIGTTPLTATIGLYWDEWSSGSGSGN